MSETELSVICKNCGSEVSPYVTECPYCGARLRKRAPKLERRGDGLEAKPRRGPASRLFRIKLRSRGRRRLPPALRDAGGDPRLRDRCSWSSRQAAPRWPRSAASPCRSTASGGASSPPRSSTSDVGYLFVVAVGLAIFGAGIERRLGTPATAVLLLACGSLGMLAASGIASAQGDIVVIAGGNGMALGAVAAWFAIRRAEAHQAIDQDYDRIGVAVAAAVLLALPIFESTANVFAGLVGGAVGGLAGLAASVVRPSE